jgi:Na+/proline symporter
MYLIDYVIIVSYLLAMLFIGLMARKKAEAGIDAYFLAGRKLPWWMLAASGMASNLDITGTMICAALVYMLGVSGMLVELRGSIVLCLAILMTFMGKWYSRSGCMTVGHWMEFRFGQGNSAKWARGLSALGALILTIGMVAYFVVGSGKFVASFLDIPAYWGLPPHVWGAAILIGLTMIYSIYSGFYGVVYTELFQSAFIVIGILTVCFMAFNYYQIPEQFSISIPLKDGSLFAFNMTKAQWGEIIPPAKLNFPAGSEYTNLNLFYFAITFYFLKVMIEGLGGPSGYMAQRYFAIKTDREAGMMSLLWVVLLAFRWPFIVGIGIMGIYYNQHVGVITDPEQVMPLVIKNMLPIGVKGFLIAALMAAAMSTFDSTINAGASYWVKDIYQAFINPKASQKTLIFNSRLATFSIIALGLILGILIQSINQVWGYLTMSISIGILVPLTIRWYWWRLNGFGFSMGTLFGMLTAIFYRLLFDDNSPVFSFCLVGSISFLATIIFSLMTPPTPKDVLEKFYKKTRPFGFWGPVRKNLPREIVKDIREENRMDILATFVAIPWQLFLFITPMLFMMKEWENFAKALFCFAVLSVGLYFLWYKRLSNKATEEILAGELLEPIS